MEFSEQGVKKIKGWEELSDVGTLDSPIRGFAQVLDGTSRHVYAGNLTNIFEIIEGTSTSVGSGFNGIENSATNNTSWDDATDTATTIAATASGFTDSANGFVSNGLVAGMELTVTGFATASINTVYTVDTVVAGTITTTPNPATTEAAGASVTYVGVTVWDSGTTLWDAAVLNPTQWSMVNFGLFVLATNGIDTPQIFKGTAFADLTGLPTTLAVTTWEIFAKRGPFVLAFNSNVDSRDFYWSDTDDPETWEPTVSNAAGDLLIRELKSGIKAVVPIGDRLAVYGDNQMFLVNFLGSPNYFGYQPALDGIGAVSKKAIIAVGRRNFGLSQQGFFVTDGVSFQYIDEPEVRKFFRNTLSFAHIGKVNGYHDEQNNQVRWYYPSATGKVDKGIIYNYNSDTWSTMDIGRSASIERAIYPNALSGAENSSNQAADGKIFFENSTNDNAGTAITAFARTKGFDMDNPELIKELDSVRIGTTGSATTGLQFRLGFSESEDSTDSDNTVWDNGTTTWDAGDTVWDSETIIFGAFENVKSGYDFSNVRTAGRWLFIEFFSDTLNAEWEVTSLDIIGRFEGTR